ncbi:hypothetical protein PM082_019985 [Marasmius tenuissimus]|nr:hypothetical protein PM082_019985 [Marasmius tenuissimus]
MVSEEDLPGESLALADNSGQGNSAQNGGSHIEKGQQLMAQPPFDNADTADIIVRTSDGTIFFVYKVILSVVSPYFQEAFMADSAIHSASSKLGHKDPEDAQGRDSTATPALAAYSIEEDSQVFSAILRYFYPGQAAPHLTTIDDLAPVLAAMVRYRMQNTTPFQTVIASLLDIAKPLTTGGAHPAVIRVFALFYKFRESIPTTSMNTVKHQSLHISLEHFSAGSCPELDQIPASALIELMKYHQTCHAAIRTHAPSFNTWREGSSQLQFKCSSQAKSAKREVLTLEEVKDLYHHLLKTYEHCPLGLTNAIPVATMLERQLECDNCDYPCSAMRNALSKMFRDEVNAALQTVDAG